MTDRPTLICVVPNPSIDRTAEVDRLEPGRIHRPAAVVAVPGGKGLNVARAGANLGQRVEAVLLLGGHAGRWIVDELDRLGIAHRETWAPGETRSCLSILDRSAGALTEVYEPGPTIPAATWTAFVDTVADAVAAAPARTLVAVAGSLPPGAPAAGSGAILRSIAHAGGRSLVDTSGRALAAALAAKPFVVKVNATEAGAVLGRPVETGDAAANAARDLAALGAERTVVTRGADGAVGWDGEQAWLVDVPRSGGPHSVGAGDAFLAGFAAGLADDQPFPDCLRRGAAAGAASTLIAGPGNLSRAETDRLLDAIVVRPA